MNGSLSNIPQLTIRRRNRESGSNLMSLISIIPPGQQPIPTTTRNRQELANPTPIRTMQNYLPAILWWQQKDNMGPQPSWDYGRIQTAKKITLTKAKAQFNMIFTAWHQARGGLLNDAGVIRDQWSSPNHHSYIPLIPTQVLYWTKGGTRMIPTTFITMRMTNAKLRMQRLVTLLPLQ